MLAPGAANPAMADTVPYAPQPKGGKSDAPNDLETLLARINQLAGNDLAPGSENAPDRDPRKSTMMTGAAAAEGRPRPARRDPTRRPRPATKTANGGRWSRRRSRTPASPRGSSSTWCSSAWERLRRHERPRSVGAARRAVPAARSRCCRR